MDRRSPDCRELANRPFREAARAFLSREEVRSPKDEARKARSRSARGDETDRSHAGENKRSE